MPDYISHSQVSMYCRCGMSYYFRYKEGKKIPPGISLLKGSSIHKGAGDNNIQKIKSHEDLRAKDIVDISVSAFESRKEKEGFILTADEQGQGVKNVIGEAKDRVAAMAGVYAVEMAPKIQPVMAEQSIMVNMPGLPPVKTVLDLVDDKKQIRDMKYAGKKKQQKDVDSSLQLTIYTIAYRVLTGELPESVWFDVLVDKKSPEYQPLCARRDIEDFKVGLSIMKAAVAGIKAEIFLPAAEGSWWCSSRMCGYFDELCPYVRRRK